MTRCQLQALALNAADENSLPHALVMAVCEQESNWIPTVTRFEPAFKAKYIDPKGEPDWVEACALATSFGVMQVMGQVAREYGYSGDLFVLLSDPATGIRFGCAKLAHCWKATNGDAIRTLLLYNGGGNPDYPKQVLAKAVKYGGVK